MKTHVFGFSWGGRIMLIFVLVLKQDHMALSSLCSPSWPLFIIPLPQPDDQKKIGQERQARRLLGMRRAESQDMYAVR